MKKKVIFANLGFPYLVYPLKDRLGESFDIITTILRKELHKEVKDI